ncbi:MAG TPA: DNA-primase RepB domain-containing protein [Tepidisphaeraceae bacterium]|jgi:hypothetical protein|nr:DNA-primase RepB domain-containing protein [Tepidisphaeraceae bacterium]
MSPIDMTNASTRAQVAAFAEAMYERDDVLEVRRLPTRKGTLASRWTTAAKLPAAVPSLLADNASGLNVYVGVNPRTGHGQRNAAGVTLSRSFVLDIDHTRDLAAVRAMLAQVLIEHDGERMPLPPPSAIVDSGHGFWFWWRLAEEMRELYVRTLALDMLVTMTGTDPSVSDSARIARLPGFTNWKEPVARSVLIEVTPGLMYSNGSAFDLLMAEAVAQARLNEIADAQRHAEAAEAAKAKMAAKRAAGLSDETARVIDRFNEVHDVRDVLEAHGYLFAPGGKGRGNATFIRPGSSNKTNGHVVTCGDGRRRSIHFSTADPLNDGKFGKGIKCGCCDAFDVFQKLAHPSDHSGAVRAAAVLLGIAHKGVPDADVIDRMADSPDAEVLRVALCETPDQDACLALLRGTIARHTGYGPQIDRIAAQLLTVASARNLTGGKR